MTRQIEALSGLGLLARFIGMTTDSRSFLSFPRHEYFRRILCNLLGGEMDRGDCPDDAEVIGPIVRNICCGNAKEYFGF
jgi:glucuronate isomerase